MHLPEGGEVGWGCVCGRQRCRWGRCVAVQTAHGEIWKRAQTNDLEAVPGQVFNADSAADLSKESAVHLNLMICGM
jgi:hypothetical protein